MREKTNSITHLVKLVAKEVFYEEFEETLKEIIDSKIKKLTPDIRVDATDFIHNIKSSLEKAGEHWSNTEVNLLRMEIDTAIATIAKNHNRSRLAISMRVKQENII